MDGSNNSLSSPDKDDSDEDHASTSALAAEADHALLFKVSLADAPILLFVCFHKALLDELQELRHSVETASLEDNSNGSELILKLQRRLEFLRLTLKYHCAAEDEVIFLALDVQVKNVVSTYSLEHNCTDELFNSIFHCLDELKDAKENTSKLFQELVFCIGILQTSICQHMLKEEEQVFPLLMQKISPKEQASLVWQFICSVPIVLLEEILPWMISCLSTDKQVEVIQCLKDIAPMEKQLQEVLISWLRINKPSSFETNVQWEGDQYGDRSLQMEKSLGLDLHSIKLKEISNWMKDKRLEIEDGVNQVNILHLWHCAMKKDIKEILKELHQIRDSSNFQNLDSVLIQLKFLADVFIFYSNAQKKFFYPLLTKVAYGWWFKANEQFLSESHIEDLQWLLFQSESGMPLCKYVERLCIELELFFVGVNKQFAVQETEVFPGISKNHCNKMPERLLGTSLHMMPLGLLKCVITWFAAHLSEKEFRSILYCLKQGNLLVHESFASLLHEWFCIGYSGKTTTEKFRQDLQHMFKSRCSFLPGKDKEADGFSFLNSDKQAHKGSTFSGKNCMLYCSSSGTNNVYTYDTPYSAEINLHIFFPATAMKLQNCPRTHAANSSSHSFLEDPKLIDLIFFFHKAIKNDLDYLVLGSSQLYGNPGLLMDFEKRFHLICFLCQIHSDAEDEIVFPALEAKGQVQNISLSYTIDHKFELEHFSKVSSLLGKLCELHFSISSIESNTWDQKMVKHHRLCRRLQEMCKSMQKLLSDHIDREEIEIWPVIREFFSNEEQRKIVGCMLGRIRAEILQDMIPWLMASLTQQEQHILKVLWSMATKNTMFDEWLGEWLQGYSVSKPKGESNYPPLQTAEPLGIISKYLSEEDFGELQERTPSNTGINFSKKDHIGDDGESSPNCPHDGKDKVLDGYQDNSECSQCMDQSGRNNKYGGNKFEEVMHPTNNKGLSNQFCDKYKHYGLLLTISQDGLERVIRRISADCSLDSRRKSYIIQNLLMSRWIVRQQISSSEVTVTGDGQELPGQHPSYRDPLLLTYGCTHYKRNCKLFAACCNQLYTCIRCHDEESDHSIDRKSITKMMCMKCLIIQPISGKCSTVSCSNFSMAKYYCRICRLFDDEREIYHCPYCNLCRVGKGLGVDYFHCMNCNACMSRSLAMHICREKSLEDNCPICHEYIFTSACPVKALPCGHVMHSTCFQEYTCFNYTCPICSKSLGDMQVYFRMLDALLAEEKISDELTGQTQAILCNDCEKKGDAPFHWLYHKCPFCGSYNTRVL